MIRNYRFGNVNDALPALARDLLVNGDEFGSRAGLTKELMHVGITLDRPWQREIVLPGRRANLAAQIYETMWVLGGRNDVAGLGSYLPRASDFSDDEATWRAGYGPRLRDYQGVDQLAYLVRTMASSPGSRQAVATIWDPTVDTEPGRDIACNNWLNLSSRLGYLDLHVAVRSNDLIWGWSGINAFEWSALLEIVAGLSGLLVGGLHFSTTSLHLYDRHWAKARQLAEVEGNWLYTDSPRFELPGTDGVGALDHIIAMWFDAERRIRTGHTVEGEVDNFPEPMLRSWLRVLQWYWSGDESWLLPLRGTRLYHAALRGTAPAGRPQQPHEVHIHQPLAQQRPSFFVFANALHAEKHAAYGDSWCRRGEPGILGNIARKVDRLDAGSSTADETPFDTALDLAVYLAKYWSWLGSGSGSPAEVEAILGEYEKGYDGELVPDTERIIEGFEMLEAGGLDAQQKLTLVGSLLAEAYVLARQRY